MTTVEQRTTATDGGPDDVPDDGPQDTLDAALPAAPGPAAEDGPAAREPLGSRFMHLWAAGASSNLADGLLMVGVPLLALTLTREPAQISLLTTAATLPWLLLAAHAGVLLDRHDRVRILLAALTLRIAVLVGGAVAAATGSLSLPLLLVLLLVFGVAEVFTDSATSVLVPGVVPTSRLAAANSRVLGVEQVANTFVGGPLAGVVLGLGAGHLFGVPAALCAVAALLVLRGLHGKVTSPGRPPEGAAVVGDGAPAEPRTSMLTELREGMRYLWAHPVVRPLLGAATVLNFTSAAYFSVFVLWVVGPGSRVGLASQAYGLLLAGLAVGAVLGAVTAERIRAHVSEARLVTGSWLVTCGFMAVPVLLPVPWAIALALAGCGYSVMVGNVVSQSMRQRLVPARLLGRVSGVGRTLSYGSMPLGAALGGVVGQVLGLPAVFVGAVVLSTVAVLWVVRAVPQRLVDEADAAREQVPDC